MIHNECCKDDTNQQRLDSFFVKRESKNWEQQCFYCGKAAFKDNKHPDRNNHSFGNKTFDPNEWFKIM